MTKITAFLKDESGAAAAEYVLILAIVGTTIVGGVTLLGTSIHDALQRAAGILDGVLKAPTP